MNNIVLAERDETDRQGLLAEGQGILPADFVEEINLTDEELEAVCAALDTNNTTTSSTVSSSNKNGEAVTSISPIMIPPGLAI